MNRDSTIAALRAAGIAEPSEEQIALFVDAGDDADRLGKALEGLRAAFNREHEDENAQLIKAMEQSAGVVEAVTAGADAVLAETQANGEALVKGMTALVEEMREQRGAISALTDLARAQEAQIEMLNKALGEPQRPRALTGATPVPAPADSKPREGVTSADLINKAMGIQREADKSGDHDTVIRMDRAIVRLNSGHAPAQVASDFNLN